MKKETILYIILALIAAAVAYLLFFRKKDEAPTVVKPSITPIKNADGSCFEVPSQLPPFSSPLTPSDAQQYLGFTGPEFTDQLQYRILGFFAAIDVQPTNERMKFFGKKAILDYLNTPSGQLPHWDVVKASLRCQTKSNFTKLMY
jgi:hypothetical protein